MPMRLVILDRDGVINHDSDAYIKSPEEWEPIDGSLDAIARLCRADYKIVVASNQSGVGRGLYDMDMLNRINARMLEQVHQRGGEIDAVFFCPHVPEDECECRKPKSGMFQQVADRLRMTLDGVPAVGDSLRDIQAARQVNAVPVLVRSGKGQNTLDNLSEEQLSEFMALVPVYDDLSAFADALLDGKLEQQISDALATQPPAAD